MGDSRGVGFTTLHYDETFTVPSVANSEKAAVC